MYPNLSLMAMDIFSILAMSAGVERLSSECKIMLTDRRNRLQIDSLQAVECIK
jgi:acyl carrier protein